MQCIFRVRCQQKAMAALSNYVVQMVNGQTPNIIGNDILCSFVNVQTIYSRREQWQQILPKARIGRNVQEHFNHFLLNPDKTIIFEVIFSQNDLDGNSNDYTSLQFLLLSVRTVAAAGWDYAVLISGPGGSQRERYSPVSEDIYYSISHSFYFFSLPTHSDELIPDFTNKVKVFAEGTQQEKWKHPAAQYKSLQFGKIMPIIPITQSTAIALLNSYSDNTMRGSWEETFHNLCSDYKNRVIKQSNHMTDAAIARILASTNDDSFLETIIFLSMCAYISSSSKEKELSIHDVISIHEFAMDLSQGVSQLIENVVDHVLGTDGCSGAGVCTLRIRTKEEAKKMYLKPVVGDIQEKDQQTSFEKKQARLKQMINNTEYFMELYLSDIQYKDFRGISAKYIDSARTRKQYYHSSEDYPKWLTYAKFYYSYLPEDQRNMELQNENQEYRVKFQKVMAKFPKKITPLNLSDIFELCPLSALSEYLKSNENIAFHYGLPFISTFLLVKKGLLYVRSGRNEMDMYYGGNLSIYRQPEDLYYHNGTTYFLAFPISVQSDIDTNEQLLISPDYNLDSVCNFKQINVSVSPEDLMNHTGKESLIHLIASSISKQFDVSNADNTIGIINCKAFVHSLIESSGGQMPWLYAYELLAKAVLLNLASQTEKLTHVALVDLERKYDVIKFFRFITIYFDRNGKNEQMKGVSLYLIDQTGTYDVLLRGEDLESVKELLALNRLYGGSQEEAIETIEAVINRRRNG